MTAKRATPTEPMDWERPSDRFLAYLDRLSQACVERDHDQLDKLLRMRLASHLPRAVLDEMEFFRRTRTSSLRAPLKLMRYHHKMRQLVTAPRDEHQLGFELRERDVAAKIVSEPTRARRAVKKPDQS
jgi:hypothetical protein